MPSDVDRLLSGYRLVQTALLGEAALFIPGYEQYDRLMGGTRTIHYGL